MTAVPPSSAVHFSVVPLILPWTAAFLVGRRAICKVECQTSTSANGFAITTASHRRLDSPQCRHLRSVKTLYVCAQMTEPPNALSCPFCDFTNYESYVLMLHVETLHSEGDSPFEVREPTASTAPDMEGARHAIGATASPSHELGEDYVECPERDCGESILLTELEVHTDMHLAEKMTADGLEGSTADSKRHPKKIKTVHGHPETHFDTRLPSALRSLDPPPSRSAPPLSGSSLEPIGWRAIFGRKSAGSRDHAQSGLTPAGPHKRLGVGDHAP